ncbi:RDD family protein [Paraconexibacter antarcticus]|uniref:RDD family protein n=1 Tax=Paraconexibacter antarcticus TaxID=2949664 RepID=UPI0026661148|nr:RDD family protein [Paraconexibacter antarcticus]
MDLPRGGWWARAGASIIDALILVAVGIAVGIVAALAGASGDGSTIAIYGFVFVATILYSPWLMAREGDANGQTVGKRAMGIRVVHAEGGPMTFSRGMMRDGVGKLVLGIIPFYTFVDVLVPLSDARKQAIHDKVGKTFVVLADAQPARSGPGLGAFTPPPPPPPAPAPAGEPPDLGAFMPPSAPTPSPPSPPSAPDDDGEPPRGPFGPRHD